MRSDHGSTQNHDAVRRQAGGPHGTFQLEEDGKPRKRRQDGTTVPRSYLPEARTNFEEKKTDRQKDYEAIWKDMEARGKL